jgi:hypothetical protein
VGIDDVLGAIGNGIEKINKYTSFAPSGLDQKPVVQLDEQGVHINGPGSRPGWTWAGASRPRA